MVERIAIFGGTGMTGKVVVTRALEKGAEVNLLVRDAYQLPISWKSLDKLNIIYGDVLNYDDVLKTIRGMNGVAIVLGTRNCLDATTLFSEGTRNIIRAMEECNIDVVSVCNSAFVFRKQEEVPEIFRPITEDHRRQLEILKSSKMRYIAVLPPHIATQEAPNYTVVYDKPAVGIVTKYHLGEFLIDCLSEPKYYGKVVSIKSHIVYPDDDEAE